MQFCQKFGMSKVYISDNWWLSYFLVPPGNQKSRLLFDRTYYFNNTSEGEYSINNYPAMQFCQKFGMSEGVHLWQSDDSARF